MSVRAYETFVALFDDKPMLVGAKGSYEIVVPLCANVKFRIVVYVRYRVHYYRWDLYTNADIYRPVLGTDAVTLNEGIYPFPANPSRTKERKSREKLLAVFEQYPRAYVVVDKQVLHLSI
jgi:hypothetical protein